MTQKINILNFKFQLYFIVFLVKQRVFQGNQKQQIQFFQLIIIYFVNPCFMVLCSISFILHHAKQPLGFLDLIRFLGVSLALSIYDVVSEFAKNTLLRVLGRAGGAEGDLAGSLDISRVSLFLDALALYVAEAPEAGLAGIRGVDTEEAVRDPALELDALHPGDDQFLGSESSKAQYQQQSSGS